MRGLIFVYITLLISACSVTGMKWDIVSGPTDTSSDIYGSYSAGCLDGAVSLAANSQTYQTMRIARQRYYGHPILIDFLKNYSETIVEKDLGILAIGDLSQARGGPMPGGHASHQIGLDADIWFKRFTPKEREILSLENIDSIPAISMVNSDALTINEQEWTADNVDVLKIASTHNDVERIFVNYVIKKKLCEKHKGEQWLSKLRPWWGHTHHYHVRLACPEGIELCKAQAPVDETDGCDETLDWWFSEEAQLKPAEDFDKKPRVIKLPLQCDEVYKS